VVRKPRREDTVDRVFLLSLDEVVRAYFGDSSRLLDNPKPNQRYWFDRKDENNAKRKALFFESPWWWWTRTPGQAQQVAVYVHGDGNIGIQGTAYRNVFQYAALPHAEQRRRRQAGHVGKAMNQCGIARLSGQRWDADTKSLHNFTGGIDGRILGIALRR
jgi:hypothetical protein